MQIGPLIDTLSKSDATCRSTAVTTRGLVYHVLERTAAGLPLFRTESDYEAPERIIIEAHGEQP